MIRATLAAASLALLACGGPLGPLPGGALSGEVKPPPADWSFVADVKQAQLETNPAKPRSVNVWLGVWQSGLYVTSSMIRGPKRPTERAWVRDVGLDPLVRMRIEGVVYELRAVRVEDPATVAAVRSTFEKKYALDALEPGREVWVFRLDPR